MNFRDPHEALRHHVTGAIERGEKEAIVEITVAERLEYLRGELRAERISYGELAELQGLADKIDPTDVELLEAAGVPESPPTRIKGVINFEGETIDDCLLAIGEAVKAIADDYTSGHNRNDTGSYSFEVEGPDPA